MKIFETSFMGSKAVELTTSKMRLVAISAYGPRIAFLGTPEGDNLFLWEPGKRLRKEWDLRGGHRVWVTRPGADESEDTYATDNGPCEVEIYDDGFRLIGETNEANATRRGIQVTVLAEDRVEVDNFVINVGNLLYSGGVWALSCTVPTESTRYAVPIGDPDSPWDTFNMVCFRRWADHGQGGYNDDQIQTKADHIYITPKGLENKRMVQAQKGIIAMTDPERQVTFAKKVAFEPGLHYPLGTNMAFYIGPDNFMVELETMGPEATIKPGTSWHHTETWVLKSESLDISNVATLETLFR